MTETVPDMLGRYKDADIDTEANLVADEYDYEKLAETIHEVLNSREAMDIVGSMELGYVLEKLRRLGPAFEEPVGRISGLIESNPRYDTMEADAVMEDLYRKADQDRGEV